MQRIEAGLLIPGRGQPVRDAVVTIEGATIAYAGPAATAPDTAGAGVIRTPVVMPGLWDCHGHFMGVRTMDLVRGLMEPVPLRAARCAGDLAAALYAGVTSVREVGGLGIHLAKAVAEGTLDGPAVHPAGAVLSTTGGHGDIHGLPLAWVLEAGCRGTELRLCDGPDECAKAAREQLRQNAKLIKVCASGGALSEVDHPIHQQFTVAELRAIVEVAGMADRIVAAHCHGKPGIMAALAAGVRTIEHGTMLDDEACAAMRETGAVLVTTRTVVAELLDSGAAPGYAMDKVRQIADTHAEAMGRAHEAGVTMAMGTDIIVSGSRLANSWGRNGRELPLLVQSGLSPLAAIEAATANGPLTLGPQAPTSGQLAEGYDADLLTIDADPLADISVLADPPRVTGVWKAGRRVK